VKQIVLTLLFFSSSSYAAHISLTKAQSEKLQKFITEKWNSQSQILKNLQEQEVISEATAQQVSQSQQSLSLKVIALHPRTCQRGLKKISLYEDYKSHMSFLQKSEYDEKKQMVFFTIDHSLLPYAMVLNFKLPRIKSESVTHYIFTHGLFKNLQGEIHVQSIDNRCVYFMQASWLGETTKLNASIVEAFAQTLTKIGLEHLMRIASL
jgi:hypothetical protein